MATATDPICLMQVDTENPNGGTSDFDGQTYYFAPRAAVWRSNGIPMAGRRAKQAHRDGGAPTATTDVCTASVPARRLGRVHTNYAGMLSSPHGDYTSPV